MPALAKAEYSLIEVLVALTLFSVAALGLSAGVVTVVRAGKVSANYTHFSVDGRNHAPDGALSALCASVSPFATAQIAAQNDLTNAAATLKREVVTRANSFCQADGSSTLAGTCTPGLAWVRGAGCAPFAVNYSCEAVTRALTVLMRTVSWTEKFGA